MELFLATDLNECSSSNPCTNGGLCTDLKYGYECDCPNGWEGDICEKGRKNV